MPYVEVKTLEGLYSAEEKRRMIEGITETFVAIEGENMRPYTWVAIVETKEKDWGIGGQLLTADYVRDHMLKNRKSA